MYIGSDEYVQLRDIVKLLDNWKNPFVSFENFQKANFNFRFFSFEFNKPICFALLDLTIYRNIINVKMSSECSISHIRHNNVNINGFMIRYFLVINLLTVHWWALMKTLNESVCCCCCCKDGMVHEVHGYLYRLSHNQCILIEVYCRLLGW